MKKLPNASRARVDKEKLTEYLLSPTHPDGRAKAEFFARFGFRLDNWAVLQEALQQHGRAYEVIREIRSSYGVRYVVEGPLTTPDGRDPVIWTVWIVDAGRTESRLVSAYPARR